MQPSCFKRNKTKDVYIFVGYLGLSEEEQPACTGCQLLDYGVLQWEGLSVPLYFPYLLPVL
jgi:hypothetical protein